MESNSLLSASAYLNNLLLARGLLPNGKAVDFAHLEHNDASRVVNLVHDLVLRRDRDAEQRENLANGLRSIRVEQGQRVLDMQRLQDKNAELTRNSTTAEAQERALKAGLRKAEIAARDLKEQMLKMKSTLDQVRAKCLSDVRKRDLEIEKLKGHLTSMQRGKRDASGGMKINTINAQPSMSGAREMRGGQDVNSSEWSLEKESNDFLAALVNETSMENVTLRGIVSGTLETLQELTGLDDHKGDMRDEDDGIGIPGKFRKSRRRAAEAAGEASLMSCETLAKNMSTILDHCRSILKDPSFVPIEEVQIREDEIIKLREGWEKMAGRWKDAVTMMDVWRRRMLEGGVDTIDMNELSDLGFGRSVAVLPNGKPVLGQDDEDLSSVLFDTSKMDMPEKESDNSEGVEEPWVDPFDDDEESDFDIPEPSPKRLALSPPKRGLRLPRPATALVETNGNTKSKATSLARPIEADEMYRSGDSKIGGLDGTVQDENDTFAGRALIQSKIPRQTKTTLPALSVSEKLAAIEAEAKEAEELRRKEEGEVTHKRKAIFKSKASGLRRSRRRSTLSPEELAALMGAR